MVAKKLDRDTLLDLYLLYKDISCDFTIACLAEKVNISRSRLGKLFKRINPESLEVNYDNNDKFKPILIEYFNGISVEKLAHKYSVSRSTLYRKFNKLTDEE